LYRPPFFHLYYNQLRTFLVCRIFKEQFEKKFNSRKFMSTSISCVQLSLQNILFFQSCGAWNFISNSTDPCNMIAGIVDDARLIERSVTTPAKVRLALSRTQICQSSTMLHFYGLLATHSSAIGYSPRKPSRTTRIFSSLENFHRVLRPDFSLIFIPQRVTMSQKSSLNKTYHLPNGR